MAADDSRRDAVVLARWLLGWDDAQWLTHRHEPAPADFAPRFEGAIARRRRREPVAYILGEREFYGRPFHVTPDVLIPRPETELIVDATLDRLGADDAATIADVGTGTGCLAITLALERPLARVVGLDSSASALTVARENARRHGALDRVQLHESDLMRGVPGLFDIIVSNPPYVPERDRASLAPEVLDYEPARALFAGLDGLDVIRALIPAAAARLRPGGWLVMEFGWGQADDVTAIVHAARELTLLEIRQDLQGIPRVAVARRPTAPMR